MVTCDDLCSVYRKVDVRSNITDVRSHADWLGHTPVSSVFRGHHDHKQSQSCDHMLTSCRMEWGIPQTHLLMMVIGWSSGMDLHLNMERCTII